MKVHKHAVPAAFARDAIVKTADYDAMYQESMQNPETFWARIAKRIDWMRFPTRIKDVSFNPAQFRVRWFEDGELNVSVNCLDRQLARRGDTRAVHVRSATASCMLRSAASAVRYAPRASSRVTASRSTCR
jgi:hypothetical protein